ncbi:MAG: cytochrome c oxidase subunit, partial [Chloroflexi bacterium]|nr:cytochrome c oxidase subunit [Chloroflexota bacterium]
MMAPETTPRRERRAIERETLRHEPRHHLDHAAERRRGRLRSITFGAIVVAVLGIGGYLAFGDFLGQRGVASGDRIAVQASMAGFTPREIRVTAGQTVTLDFWTQDSSGHLKGGVHTMINQDLGILAELPGADGVAESRMAVIFVAPMTPGEYDIYCDTCCG